MQDYQAYNAVLHFSTFFSKKMVAIQSHTRIDWMFTEEKVLGAGHKTLATHKTFMNSLNSQIEILHHGVKKGSIRQLNWFHNIIWTTFSHLQSKRWIVLFFFFVLLSVAIQFTFEYLDLIQNFMYLVCCRCISLSIHIYYI